MVNYLVGVGVKRHGSHNFQPPYAFIRDDTVLAFWTFIQNKQKTGQQLVIHLHTGSNVCSPVQFVGDCPQMDKSVSVSGDSCVVLSEDT